MFLKSHSSTGGTATFHPFSGGLQKSWALETFKGPPATLKAFSLDPIDDIYTVKTVSWCLQLRFHGFHSHCEHDLNYCVVWPVFPLGQLFNLGNSKFACSGINRLVSIGSLGVTCVHKRCIISRHFGCTTNYDSRNCMSRYTRLSYHGCVTSSKRLECINYIT